MTSISDAGAALPPTDFRLAETFDACDLRAAPTDAYEALLARLRHEYVPFAVTWELTHLCNLHCVMCYNVPQAAPELTTAECLDILEQLAAAGTLRLTLTGGEILTRQDFLVIAGRARELGFALNLKTNGTLLTPVLAEKVAALAPAQVDISLLGATPETSDAVMGGRQTLAQIVHGVRLLSERGVRVKLNTLLLDLNAAEQRPMVNLARELGVCYGQFCKVSPADDRTDESVQHQLTLAQMTVALVADQSPFTPRSPAASTRTCSVGLSSCLISPNGIVYPCVELRIPAGSLAGVRRQRFTEIWAEAPILRELRERHTYANLAACRDCSLNRYCEARCAGLAWKEHGDLYGGHAVACQYAQACYAQQHPGAPVPSTSLQYGDSAICDAIF